MNYRVKYFDNRKIRKKRGIKKSGEESFDFCTGCYYPYCDPMALSPRIERKIHDRLENGLCPACGHKKCKCKSK